MASKPKDFTGVNILGFVAIRRTEKTSSGDFKWLWHCTPPCIGVFEARPADVRTGKLLGCGCKGRPNRAPNRIQTFADQTLFSSWDHAKQRCFNSNNDSYHNYGGRGITMAPEWKDNFVAFRDYILQTIGPRPSFDHTLDRVNNNGNYEPGNLRWATRKEQAANSRRHQ